MTAFLIKFFTFPIPFIAESPARLSEVNKGVSELTCRT